MEIVKFEKLDNIAKITLNRPEVLNALNEESFKLINNYLKEIEKDENIRAVILTGTGRGFCVGIDLKVIRNYLDKGERFPYKEFLVENFNKLISNIINLQKPVIASINGVVAGAGIGIALACDYKIASNNVRFVEAFINVALIPDTLTCYLLLRNIGLSKTIEYLTLGGEISAEEALKLGLINKVVPQEKLEEETNNIAKRYSEMPTKVIGLTKKLIYNSLYKSIEEILEYESLLQEAASLTEDHKEGLNAFIEKRKPVFKGK